MKTDNRILDIITYISFHAFISLIVFMIFVRPIDKRLDNLESYPTKPIPIFDKHLLRDGCSLNYFNNETEKTGYDLANHNKNFYSKTVLLVCETPFNQNEK